MSHFAVLRDGVVPLIHTSHYQWRPSREAEKEIGDEWLIRNFKPTKERCEEIFQERKKRYLMHEGYKEDQPYKTQTWMRPDDPGQEIHPPRRYGDRTENERIIRSITRNVKMIDHAEKDNTMLWHPRWKNGYKTKNKWITTRGFNTTT